jgi:hypothetical protein
VPERVEPKFATDERTMLVEFLNYYRDSLELKSEGLSDAAAATASCPPSILTITGLFRHMTEVERNWFRRCFAADDVPPEYYSEERPDGDLEVEPDMSLAEAIGTWRHEIAVCDAILDEVTDLSDLSTAARHGHHPSMRWILVHLIEEYARHCGHADLIRERIDGAVGV